MRMRHMLVTGLSLSVALAVGACASSRTGDSAAESAGSASAATANRSGSDSTVQVTVTHNRPDGGITTVYIEPASGTRVTLGTIESGTTRTFTYRVQSQTRQVRLIALNSMGQALQSESITVPRGAGLSWDLGVNSVRIRR